MKTVKNGRRLGRQRRMVVGGKMNNDRSMTATTADKRRRTERDKGQNELLKVGKATTKRTLQCARIELTD